MSSRKDKRWRQERAPRRRDDARPEDLGDVGPRDVPEEEQRSGRALQDRPEGAAGQEHWGRPGRADQGRESYGEPADAGYNPRDVLEWGQQAYGREQGFGEQYGDQGWEGGQPGHEQRPPMIDIKPAGPGPQPGYSRQGPGAEQFHEGSPPGPGRPGRGPEQQAPHADAYRREPGTGFGRPDHGRSDWAQRHLDDPTRSRRPGAVPAGGLARDPRLPAQESRDNWQRGAGREEWRMTNVPGQRREEPGREDWARGYERGSWSSAENRGEAPAERPLSEQRGRWARRDEPDTPTHDSWEGGGWTGPPEERGSFGRQRGGYGDYGRPRGPQDDYGELRESHAGKGPKGYRRSDARIREEVSEQLFVDERVDASNIEVDVQAGVVILRGTVRDRRMKHVVDDIADDILGVVEVQNELRVARDDEIRDAARETLARFPDESRTFGINRR